MLETPVILEIEGIEAGEVALTSNIPKSLQIATRTSMGPMVVRISESTALELTDANEFRHFLALDSDLPQASLAPTRQLDTIGRTAVMSALNVGG